MNRRNIAKVQKDIPVIVGEWCICNKYADKMDRSVMDETRRQQEQRRKYREIARMELEAWEDASGWFYWNYQLFRDREIPMDPTWKESWDLTRCLKHGWLKI